MERQGHQMPRTVTLKESGLTGEAWVLTLVLLWLTFFSLSLTMGLHSAAIRLSTG